METEKTHDTTSEYPVFGWYLKPIAPEYYSFHPLVVTLLLSKHVPRPQSTPHTVQHSTLHNCNSLPFTCFTSRLWPSFINNWIIVFCVNYCLLCELLSFVLCLLCYAIVFMLFCCYYVVLLLCCSVIVLSYVLIVCTVPLPPGVNPIAVDKYININNISWNVSASVPLLFWHSDFQRLLAINSYSITGLDRSWELPDVVAPRISRKSAHEGGKVVSPTYIPLLPPRTAFLKLFSSGDHFH